MSATETIVTIRAKAFSCEDIRTHKCIVEANGVVRVWDSVAGYYTLRHSLSAAAQRRAREAAGMAS